MSPASNAQGLSHMHDDSEREIVLLGPTTNPSSLTDNEILGSPSGEVILKIIPILLAEIKVKQILNLAIRPCKQFRIN